MTPTVVSVRQNLVPLVEKGRVNPGCATGGEHEWGDTIGQTAFIDRSGFGVTATGEEVYAAGPALSVCTLGAVLADAGVVRGMELDINPSWVSGAYFTRSGSGGPGGHPAAGGGGACRPPPLPGGGGAPEPLPDAVEPRLVLLVPTLTGRS